MAEDRLMFRIGFDLDDAVKDAEHDFEKVLLKLQLAAQNKPLKLAIDADLKSIEAAEGSISSLREQMAKLSKAWNSITNTAKFNDDGTLTKDAKELADEYMAATDSMAKYGMTLEQITRARKQAIVDEQKAEEKRYNDWLRNKHQEVVENERVERQKQAATARTIAEQNKEYERQAAAEQKRQAAISASLRAEYQKIDLKRQAEAASKRELEMLNAQYRAEEARNRLARQDERIKQLGRLRGALQAEENSIANINAKLQIYRQRMQSAEINGRQFTQAAKQVERLSKKLEDANNRVAQLTGQTVAGQRRMTSAVEETNRAYSSTEGYISRLLRRTAVLYGIHQVARFAERLREVTAEFELQRVSLGAIIQDQERANALFSQIKTFAVQSPFEIKDLVGYVKQLSAYRIETDKLFDTTKRLADVSAGLGVDMQRIILAYGQVKAASVLRGCLGVDTEILTTSGTKKVQDIQVGDKLLNENNDVVTVKELIRGREQMYRVIQSNGMEYRVNENHILTLYKDGKLHDVYVKDAIADAELLGVRYFEGRLITYPIKIEKDIVDDYYGFVLDGNKRFQLGDGTVTHNTEVRQFTEAGIPLIELLAEKFTALRGEMVSTGEVFDLISQRAVSFEMVAEIFEDMTNAGGMFYKMQEKQAATLAGQWSNLKDSLSIMYDEMGNTSGVRGAMEGVISTVKTLAENWQLVSGLITQTLGGAVILGVVNKFKSLWNMLGVQMYSATQKVSVAQDRYNAVLGRYGALSKNATRLEREAIVLKYQAAKAALASAKATEAVAASTSRLAFAWKKFTMLLKANWITVVIGALVTLYQVISHVVRKSNELKNALADIEREGVKNIATTTWNFERLAKKAVEAADGSNEQREALEELQRTYKDMIPTHQLTIENLRKLEGNYRSLTDAVREYAEAQIYVKKYETILANTQEKASEIADVLKGKLSDGIQEQVGWFADRKPFQFKYDKQQLNTVFDNIRMLAQTTSDDVETIISKAFEAADINLTGAQVEALSQISGYNNNFEKLIAAWRDGEQQLKDLDDEQERSANKFGIYGKYIDDATDAINEWKNANKDLRDTSPFDFNKQLLEQSSKEYRTAIEKIIEDANKGLSADKKIKLNEDWFSGEYIDTTAILKSLQDAGLDISSQAYKSAEKIQTAYSQFVPSTEFVKAINGKFQQIGRSMGDNVLNVINQDLMNADEGINDFVKRFFDTLDSLKLQVKQKEALLKSGDVTGENRKSEEESLRRLKIRLEAHKKMASYMEQYRMQQERGGGGGDNADIQRLKLMVSLLEKVYAKYKDYLSIMSQSEAQTKISDYFGETLGLFEKFSIALPRTAREFQAALRKLQAEAARLGDVQLVQQLGYKWGEVDFTETKSEIESELKRLADEVSRTKTAKEFFDKMLNLTGDQELSANITMSVYGAKGDDLKRKIIDQIRNAFGTTTGEELDLSLAINYNTLEVDYLKLAQIAEENKDILLESSKATRDGIIKNGLETTAARIMQWEKDIQKEKSFAEKRIQIAQETAQQIINIERSNLPKEEKERLTTGYKQHETEQVGQLMWDNFKNTPLYVKMFDNLETASTTMLNAMRDKLKGLESQWGKSLNPTELKELQSRMNEIDQQLAMKNPFKTLGNAIKEYMALREQGTRKQAETQYAADVEANKKAWDELNAATARAEQAKINYERVKSDPNASDKELFNARALLDLSNSRVENAKEEVDETDEAAKKSGKLLSRWEKLADATKNASTAIGAYTEMITKAGQGIIQMMDAFGASEEDMQFMEDIVGGIGKIGQGAQDAVAGILSGNPVAAISGIVSGLGSIVSGVTDIFYAGRIKRANKEIARQQKILDALEHSYDRLQKAAEQLFGSEFVANYAKQQKNLQAQIAATQKQLAAERSKGKKADDEKIKQYEEQIQSLKDELEDMQSRVAEQMLGTDLASAARSFAQAWLEAYKEFGDTRKAIEGEMQKLMENLIVEALLGQIMKTALEPVFKMFEGITPEQIADMDFIKKVVDEAKKASEYANTGANVMASAWEDAGMNFRELGDGFTGISKDIATASEESILGLSSLINTSLFYVSNIDRNVAQIVAMMTGGGYEVASGEQLTDLITIQNQHLSYLPSIALYTSQTAERCERAAAACENIAENLNRVIKPNGVQGSYRVNTSL